MVSTSADRPVLTPDLAGTVAYAGVDPTLEGRALQDALRDQYVLLLLDNFEHVLESAPLVATLLAAAPGLGVLVTSREMLHLHGEKEVVVPPLKLPNVQHDLSEAF